MKTRLCSVLALTLAMAVLWAALPSRADPAFDSRCPRAFELTATAKKGAVFRPDGQETALHLEKGAMMKVEAVQNNKYQVLYEGHTGLIKADDVTLGGRALAQMPEAANASLALADLLPRRQDGGYLLFEGSLTVDEGAAPVKLFVWDERALAVEKVCLIVPEGNEIPSEALSRLIKVDSLKAGRKTIVIQGMSGGRESVLARLVLSVRGRAQETAHITDQCGISAKRVLDDDPTTAWAPDKKRPSLQITFPGDGSAALMTIEWLTVPASYTVTLTDAAGLLLSEEEYATGFFLDTLSLPEKAAAAVITPDGGSIATLRVYPQSYAAHAVQAWEKTAEKTDLMLFVAHQDDEYLFFGGMIPYYTAQGKTVTPVYLAGTNRKRIREALDGLWTVGLRQYPVFMGFKDTAVESLDVALGIWQRKGADPLMEIVRLIRQQRPEVIVTHDFQGEYGHVQHKLTAKLVTEAASLSADPAYDPESASALGVWQVKKVYVHLLDDDGAPTLLDWSQPICEGSVITPLFLAEEGFDKHRSQQGMFTVERYGMELYDCRAFGLYYSSVGDDVLKNDLFEHLP